MLLQRRYMRVMKKMSLSGDRRPKDPSLRRAFVFQYNTQSLARRLPHPERVRRRQEEAAMSPEAVRKEAGPTNVTIPVEVVCWDEATSQAIASHHEKGGSLIIEARCFIEHHDVNGRKVP